jgi:hypothetical protein
MNDRLFAMQAKPEKLLADAAECALISKLATDRVKQELFARLAAHLKAVAADLQRMIDEKQAGSPA